MSEVWVRSQAPTHVALVSVAIYMRARELTLNPPMKRRTRLAVVDPLQGRVNCGLCRRVMARKNDSYVCQPKATGRDSKTLIDATSVVAKRDRLIEAVLNWADSQDVSINISRRTSSAEFNLAMTRERLTVCCSLSAYTVTVAP
jgi:hypothetical protein